MYGNADDRSKVGLLYAGPSSLKDNKVLLSEVLTSMIQSE